MSFYEERVKGAAQKVEKLTKKIERIKVALETGKNPYYYIESDLNRAETDLINAKDQLAKYQDKVSVEQQRINTYVPVIEEFLDKWFSNAYEWHERKAKEYTDILEECIKKEKELEKKCKSSSCWTEYHKAVKEINAEYMDKINTAAAVIKDYMIGCELDQERLTKHLTAEKNKKRQKLVNRVTEIVGEITDAAGLFIGNNGDINGFVKGTKSNASLETITAGGYNIQCFHFRVLVREVKEVARRG